MQPIGEEGLKSLQLGTRVGLSKKGTYSNGNPWQIVAWGTVESLPKEFMLNTLVAVVVVGKVFFQKHFPTAIHPGDRYIATADDLYANTEACSVCKGEGQEVHGQEGKGYSYTCEHCGGVGLEPLTVS